MSTHMRGALQEMLVQADDASQPRSTPLNMLAWPQAVLLTAGGSGTLLAEILTSSIQPGHRESSDQAECEGLVHSYKLFFLIYRGIIKLLTAMNQRK